MADITFLIVHYKTPNFTDLCVKTIEKFTSSKYKILIINNGPSDIFTATTKHSVLRFNSHVIGSDAHGKALNYGFNFVDSELTCIVDSDCAFLYSGWDKQLEAYIKGNVKMVGVMAGAKKIYKGMRTNGANLALFRTKFMKKMRPDFTPDMANNIDTCGKLSILLNKRGHDIKYIPHVSCHKKPCKIMVGVHCAEYVDNGVPLWAHFGRGSSRQKARCVYRVEEKKWTEAIGKLLAAK